MGPYHLVDLRLGPLRPRPPPSSPEVTSPADSRRGHTAPRDVATAAFIGAVFLVGLVLLVGSSYRYGFGPLLEFGILTVLVGALLFVDEVVVEGRTRLSLWSILLLACQALVGPAAAGLLGAVMGLFIGRSLALRNRLFNLAQTSVCASLGGLAFKAAGGDMPTRDVSVLDVVTQLAVPMLVADVAMLVGNIGLLAGVVAVSEGHLVRQIILPLLRNTGLAYLGYGIIAFLMVVLWKPAAVGPAAAVLALAPLLVAQWAYRQHAEELRGQDRALEVLVAAVEAKAPQLTGHSGRVADLSARIAEELGLASTVVGDVRFAGMLHDVGRTSLPTRVVRQAGADAPELHSHPQRGAELLTGIGFLQGALGPIADHGTVLDRPAAADPQHDPARVVAVADTYDLLTEVGTPDGRRLTTGEALAALRERPGVDGRLLHALETALRRGA